MMIGAWDVVATGPHSSWTIDICLLHWTVATATWTLSLEGRTCEEVVPKAKAATCRSFFPFWRVLNHWPEVVESDDLEFLFQQYNRYTETVLRH